MREYFGLGFVIFMANQFEQETIKEITGKIIKDVIFDDELENHNSVTILFTDGSDVTIVCNGICSISNITFQ